ncbi:GNAT family N-acetyltransferase [Streptomyces sp. 2MCAF27]
MLDATPLTGTHVRLEPLEHRHHDGLCEAIRDGKLWDLAVTIVPHPGDVRAFINDAHTAQAAGTQLAYATLDLATGKIAGSTRLLAINEPCRRLEIGFTFLGRSWQRTAVNTEAKLPTSTESRTPGNSRSRPPSSRSPGPRAPQASATSQPRPISSS